MLPQTLNYPDVKQKGASARSYRAKISSSNGISFSMSQQLVFQVASQPNTYIDYNSAYILMDVTNNHGDALEFDGNAGAYSMLRDATCASSAGTLSNITGFNVLMNILFDSDVGKNYIRSTGSTLLGCKADGSRANGREIAAGATTTVALPLALLSLANTSPARFCPAFGTQVEWRFTLDGAKNAFFNDDGTDDLVDSQITINNVSLCYYAVEVAQEVQNQIDAMNNGVYQLMANDWLSSRATISKSAQSFSQTLGWSAGSLEKILVSNCVSAQRNNSAKHSLSFRSVGGLTELQLSANNRLYPARPLEVKNECAEVMAELLISGHSLGNFNHNANFNEGGADLYSVADASNATEGSFVAGLELESYAGSGASSKIYTGLNIRQGTTQLLSTFTGGATQELIQDVFGLRTIELVLDTRGLNTLQSSA